MIAAATLAAALTAAAPVHPTVTPDGWLRCPAGTAIPDRQLDDGADRADTCKPLTR